MSELVCIKAKIEDENTLLLGERAKLIDLLNKVQAEKIAKRRDLVEIKSKVFIDRVELKGLAAHVEALATHVESQRQVNGICDMDIEGELRMTQYSEKIENLRQEFENAIHLYGEDNLQMELLKQNNSNREKRVELTRLTQAIEAKKKQIEVEHQEREKNKIEAENLEREKKRIEAERKEKEKNDTEAERQEKDKQVELAPSFRQITSPAPEPKRHDNNTRPNAPSFLPTFSQLCKW